MDDNQIKNQVIDETINKKTKKERSPKQIEALEKGRQKRLELTRLKNEAFKKFQDKIERTDDAKQIIDEINNEEESIKQKKQKYDDLIRQQNDIDVLLKQQEDAMKKKKALKKQPIEEESSDEEVIVLKNKKKDTKTKKKKIIYQDDDDDDEEEEIEYVPKKTINKHPKKQAIAPPVQLFKFI
jgi:hypothetical protein